MNHLILLFLILTPPFQCLHDEHLSIITRETNVTLLTLLVQSYFEKNNLGFVLYLAYETLLNELAL